MPSTRLDQWVSSRCCTVSWIVVPVWVKEKLGSADSQTLEHWAIVLLEAYLFFHSGGLEKENKSIPLLDPIASIQSGIGVPEIKS